jgi:hypothetical protein
VRYLMVNRVDEKRPGAFEPTPEVFVEMGKLLEEMTKAGVLLAAEGVLPTAVGARIRYQDDKRTVTDGPFTEAKEVIAGIAIVEAPSMQVAIDWADRFAAVIGDCEVEVRQIAEAPPE